MTEAEEPRFCDSLVPWSMVEVTMVVLSYCSGHLHPRPPFLPRLLPS